MRSFISYFLRLKGSAGRTAAGLLVCSKDRKILIKIKILKMRLRLPYEEARGLRSFAFQKDSNYSKNLLERSV